MAGLWRQSPTAGWLWTLPWTIPCCPRVGIRGSPLELADHVMQTADRPSEFRGLGQEPVLNGGVQTDDFPQMAWSHASQLENLGAAATQNVNAHCPAQVRSGERQARMRRELPERGSLPAARMPPVGVAAVDTLENELADIDHRGRSSIAVDFAQGLDERLDVGPLAERSRHTVRRRLVSARHGADANCMKRANNRKRARR